MTKQKLAPAPRVPPAPALAEDTATLSQRVLEVLKERRGNGLNARSLAMHMGAANPTERQVDILNGVLDDLALQDKAYSRLEPTGSNGSSTKKWYEGKRPRY